MHQLVLELGHDWFRLLSERDEETSQSEAVAAAWEEHRDETLAAWIAESPGTRPWAWWVFDAPERRRRIDGKPHPFDHPERIAKVARWRGEYPEQADRNAEKLYYGCPGCLMTLDDFAAEFESETDYLDRLGLLTEAERDALAL